MPVERCRGVDALVPRYEELRGHVLDRGGTDGRFGLTLLLRHGLAAWSEEQLACTSPRADTSSARSGDLLPDDVHEDVVRIVANMALSNLQQEVRA